MSPWIDHAAAGDAMQRPLPRAAQVAPAARCAAGFFAAAFFVAGLLVAVFLRAAVFFFAAFFAGAAFAAAAGAAADSFFADLPFAFLAPRPNRPPRFGRVGDVGIPPPDVRAKGEASRNFVLNRLKAVIPESSSDRCRCRNTALPNRVS